MGKDKKAQDKMKLAQGLDVAQLERDKVAFNSYGLNAVLDQVMNEWLHPLSPPLSLPLSLFTRHSHVHCIILPQVEGMFKLIYIDPDMMQTAYESDDEEEESTPGSSELELSGSATKEEEEGVGNMRGVMNRLKRQQTVELAMYNQFQKTYAKKPVLNQRYEDLFRNKKTDLSNDNDMSESSERRGSVTSHVSALEFDPNRRRDEELSIAAPGQEQQLLQDLGVDDEVRSRHPCPALPCLSAWRMCC